MQNKLMNSTFPEYKENIELSGLSCGLGQDITSKDKQKVFLKAGTPITEKISEQIQQLKASGIISDDNPDDCIQLDCTTPSSELVSSIMDTVNCNPILSNHQLTQTLQTISEYVNTEKIPKKIIEHLTVFSKSNPKEFEHTLTNLIFGTHIGKAHHYSVTQLHDLMCVLFYEDIGFARLDPTMNNAFKVHPILSKEIVEYAGISNSEILTAIEQHEEKLDGSGYPNKLTKIHEYAQISQIANQYSRLFCANNDSETLMGEVILLGQQFDFRTSNIKPSIYDPKLQQPLIDILQEKLKSEQQLNKYAQHLHQELSNVIKWSNSKNSEDNEVINIQRKIRSSLWVSDESIQPFKVSSAELVDTTLCREFITDSMRFIHSLVESANYLNSVLHKPIELNGSPISGDTLLHIANPMKF